MRHVEVVQSCQATKCVPAAGYIEDHLKRTVLPTFLSGLRIPSDLLLK